MARDISIRISVESLNKLRTEFDGCLKKRFTIRKFEKISTRELIDLAIDAAIELYSTPKYSMKMN